MEATWMDQGQNTRSILELLLQEPGEIIGSTLGIKPLLYQDKPYGAITAAHLTLEGMHSLFV